MTNPQPPVETDAPEPRAFAVDTHCHLFLMEGDMAEVVRAARRARVERLICVGIDPVSSRRSLEMAESFRGVFATAGVHPHSASEFDRPAGSAIEELLADPLVVGVGETGLDYYRRLSLPDDQQRAFRTHIALSRETGKPLVVHVRDAWDDALRILAEEGAERVVLHCFSGDEQVVREAAGRGYFLSFAGNLTYPGAGPLKAAATAAPEGQVLVETDSPFLTPQAARGAPNSPANVVETAAALASLRGLNLDAMVRLTAEASFQAFPLLR
ncbi:MAG: TatD family deoxyribonuclease [Actinobacteria bacterium]|nr:MAG: TatD family deoxyribonuclease [Actinomycetota bacterium]